MTRMPRRSSGARAVRELLDQPLDCLRVVHGPHGPQRPLPVRAVEGFQAGVDGVERDQGAARPGAARRGPGPAGSARGRCVGMRRTLRPARQREDALRGRRVVQPAQADERLGPHARRVVGQRRDERLGVEPVQLRLAVGQGPQGELADGGIAGELEQRRVRVLAVELLQREDRRDAPFQRRG